MSSEHAANPSWKKLEALAEAEIQDTLRSLPRPLRAAAQRVPVTYEPCPSDELVADGIAPDTLGLFVGPPFQDEQATASPLPAQIIFYLDNLWNVAEGDEEIYREEVHTTLLHELGHYLGLDEEDLESRGLE